MKLFLGETMKRLRQEKGLTQEQLSDKLGVSFQSVSRWEGGSSYPDIELIPEIAGFFHVSIDELMGMDQSLRDKKLNEALQQLAGNVPLEERIKIQRQIHRDFPHDSGVLYGLIHTLGELCEEGQERIYFEELKQFAEEYLALPGEATYYRDFVKTELITAAPEEEAADMIARYSSEFDMRAGALLKKRYEYRGDRERCNAQKQVNLINGIYAFVFGGTPEPSNAKEVAGIQTKALRILNLLSNRDGDTLIPTTPDLWCPFRIWLGINLAFSLSSITGRQESALDVLESTIVLAENVSQIPDGTVLAAETEGLGDISVCVSSSPASKLYHFRHPLFQYLNQEKVFRSIHTAIQPKWLDREEFDPIRKDLRFTICSERVQKMAAIETREPF